MVNDSINDKRVNQHLTGMTAAQASDYLSHYAFTQAQLDALTPEIVKTYLNSKNLPTSDVKDNMTAAQLKTYLAQNQWFTGEIQFQAYMPQHLGLDWNDTLQFQNAQLLKDDAGKFEKLLAAEQAFSTDPDCKPKEIVGSCKALADYQELKSKDVKGNLTVVYDPTVRKQAIQTQAYLNWIKTNYGTSLTFTAAKGVFNGSGTDEAAQ